MFVGEHNALTERVTFAKTLAAIGLCIHYLTKDMVPSIPRELCVYQAMSDIFIAGVLNELIKQAIC